jgi:hypothetical protein
MTATGHAANRELARRRQKRYRDRQRAGVIVLPLPVDQVVLADALVAAKFLHENDCDNRKKVVAALAHVIGLWCKSMSVTRNDMGRDFARLRVRLKSRIDG